MKDVHELEIFAPINDFPDYLITSHGRVLSLKDNKGKRRIKELKQSKNNKKTGYNQVILHKNGKRYPKKVHRLVAQTFIPNTENKPQVNHIDENKTNNHVSNLEWMTSKENNNHGTRNERTSNTLKGRKFSKESKQKMSISRKGKCKGVNHPRSKSVIGFKINGCDIKYYKYMSECERDGFNLTHISSCCKGKRKSHKGYTWQYIDNKNED